MGLEEALFDYLTADAGVAAIASSMDNPDRIYRVRLPEKAVLPAAKFTQVSADRRYTHDPFETQAPWVRKRIQIDCFHTSIDTVNELGDAILRALSGYTGFMLDLLISSVYCINEFETYEEDTKLYRRIMDFMVAYEDTPDQGSSS